ncbi:unnamed protein product [Allacma fusca]|uniref:hAT-like transposase RNase-H fold domain-containing protein n=1 Tax=Allacma fusca TaxID=39272 RepID=A0A8J2JWH4_9HEXA|nr:unnamed protein product [Allacma fusca]
MEADGEDQETSDEEQDSEIDEDHYMNPQIPEFDENEQILDGMNPSFKRLTCFIHTILVCLKKFTVDPRIHFVIGKVKELVSKFSKSAKLTSELVKVSKVGLISFCETRWNYIYLVFKRLCLLKDNVESVLKMHGKHKYIISEDNWEIITRCVDFLQPFHLYTCKVGKEKEAVSSEVIVTILSIYHHLDQYDSDDIFKDSACLIKSSLKQKFSKWFHESAVGFDATYLIATTLDPRYRMILPIDKQELAKKYLLSEFNLMNPVTVQESINSSTCTSAPNECEPKKSKFPLVTEMKDQIRRMQLSSMAAAQNGLQEQLQKYLSNHAFDNLDEDADLQIRVLVWMRLLLTNVTSNFVKYEFTITGFN